MFNPRVRCGLSVLICALMIAFTFIATATRFNPAFVRTGIDSLAAELSRETGRPVKACLRDREGQLVLEVRYSPRDDLYLDTIGCLTEMKALMELAAIKYRGFADEVSVNAIASASIPLLEDIPEVRNVTQTVTELRRRFDRKQILESGGRRWPKDGGVSYGPWKHIIIHHSASFGGSAKAFDRYHSKVRKWDGGLGYHFVIGNGNGSRDGQIEAGRRWSQQRAGAHAGVKEFNEEGIGICMVGNFASDDELAGAKPASQRKPGQTSTPTRKQMESLRFLALYLSLRLKMAPENMVGHRDVKRTVCPGANFPLERFRREIRRDLQRLRQAEE
jgi:N-acetylmuramoyl-L-alanine amidase